MDLGVGSIEKGGAGMRNVIEAQVSA